MKKKSFGLFKLWGTWNWLMREGSVLWRSLLDPETPMLARVVALGVIAYVVSPIDLIPDFIPFVGWIDDLILIPLGFAMVRALVPEHVWLRSGGERIERRHRRRGGNPYAYETLKDVTPR